MFITPIINKATPKPEGYTIHENRVENLKEYVYTNNQKFGEGPTAWRANTRSKFQEIYGANTQSQNWEKVEANGNIVTYTVVAFTGDGSVATPYSPKYEANKYYTKSGTEYTLLTSADAPANWGTGEFYTKD